MLERIFGKPKQEVQVVEPDVKPNYIVPEELAEKWKKKGYDTKDEIRTFLDTLDRVDLMRFQDAKQFDGTGCEDAVWEASSDSEWKREYPLGEHGYTERIPSIVLDTIPISYKRPKNSKGREIDLDLNDLVAQVEGLQKKLDRLLKLVENTEVTMSGKTAINL